MAVAITATEQDVYPPRVLLSVTGLTIGNSIELFRVVGGERTAVRAGSDDLVTDTSFLRIDAELPFGVPVSYVAVVNGTDEYATASDTYTLSGAGVVVTDAISGLAAEAPILAWDEKRYTRRASVFQAGSRNVVVSGPMPGFASTIEFIPGTTSQRDNLFEALAAATEGVVQIRQPGGYDGVDCYVSVTGVGDRRHSQDGTDQRRIISADVVEVEAWAATLEARGYTLQDIANVYDVNGPNLITNSYFETNVTGYTGSNGTVTRSTAQAHEGVASLLFTPNGTSANGGVTGPSFTFGASQRLHIEMWVRCAASRNVRFTVIHGSNIDNPTLAVTANTWTNFTYELTTGLSTTSVQINPLLLESTPPSSHLTYIDEFVAYQVGALIDLSSNYATLLDIAQADFS